MKRLIFSLSLISILVAGCTTPEVKPTQPLASTTAPTAAVPPTVAPTVAKPTDVPPTSTAVPTVASTVSAATATTKPQITNTVAPTTAATPAPSASTSFVPQGQSVWEVPPAADQLVGTCKSNPITIPYGLIAVTQSGNALTMRDQGIGEYTLNKVAENVFAYNGPSNIAPGNLEMTMTFVSSTSWTMRAVTVLKSDPACQHIHNYVAVFKWLR